MRLYTADLSRKFTGEASSHSLIAIAVAVMALLGVLAYAVLPLVLWHLNQSRIALSRSRSLDAVPSGYVDVSPGIQVVRLRDDRPRDREPETAFRN